MAMVQQTVDHITWVRDDQGHSYGETPELFEQDTGKPPPELPAGINERVYIPGRYHALKHDGDVLGGGLMPWSEGDALIAQAEQLQAKKTQREIDELEARRTQVRQDAEQMQQVRKRQLEQTQVNQPLPPPKP
jgi:hypothetical protein